MAITSKTSLLQQDLGKSLHDVPLPAAVLDLAAVRRNCQRVLEAANELEWAVRYGVSGHKTAEITKLQIGEDPEDVRISVSSLSDAEELLPLLLEYQQKGLQVNVLYTIPVPKSQVERIANLARILGRNGGTIGLLIDHEAQIPLLLQISEISGYPPSVYIAIKPDVYPGGHTFGLRADSPEFRRLFHQIEKMVRRDKKIKIAFVGLHCSPGLVSNVWDWSIMEMLETVEHWIDCLDKAALVDELRLSLPEIPILAHFPRMLDGTPDDETLTARLTLRNTLNRVHAKKHRIEVHASDYILPGLKGDVDSYRSTTLHPDSAPLAILTEVTSVYADGVANKCADATVAIGKSILGSDKSTTISMGLVYPLTTNALSDYRGFINRADKDFSVAVIEQGKDLQCGQKVKVIPFKATEASEHFGWYYVVDSSRSDRGNEIVDIFIKWRD